MPVINIEQNYYNCHVFIQCNLKARCREMGIYKSFQSLTTEEKSRQHIFLKLKAFIRGRGLKVIIT